jgi:squalene-hopene/tetraprenyl-beta-curcumene cyclase
MTMASRNLGLVSVVQWLLILVSAAHAFAGENAAGKWNQAGAAQYLDRREGEWFNFGSAKRGQATNATTCISCHSLLPYALARPALRRISDEKAPTALEAKILEQARRRVENWDRLDTPAFQLMYDFDDAKKQQSRGTESILNALILALDDEFRGRQKPSDDTRKALAILWATQLRQGEHKGSWDWLNFGLEPWESPAARYLGASLAAIAVGAAGETSATGRDAGAYEGLDSLRHYLKTHFDAQNLHNRVWMLWAAQKLDGLLTKQQRDRLIEEIIAKQQTSGGWSLVSLGDFKRKGVTSDATQADGYATGLILHVLQLAGVPKENPQVSKGLSWLRSNQDSAGGWRAMSLNQNRSPESPNPAKAHVGKFMWDAATAYAVLALGR